MRRVPKQARSQQRVNQILDTAAAMFEEVGFEAATTNAIAERAGVPVGSLYQFFPNKQALYDALVERYIEDLSAGYQRLLNHEGVGPTPFTQVIDEMIDGLIAFEQSHAGFGAIFVADSGGQAPESKSLIHRQIVASVERLIGAYFPALTSEHRTQAAVTGVGIVKGMMILMKPPEMLAPAVAARETKTAIIAYIRAFLEREGYAVDEQVFGG